jgi:multicomponent Na+:H+ antiporter subunit D
MTASGIFIHPATWFILGAFLLPFAKRVRLHKPLLVAVPLIAFLLIQQLPETFGVVNYLGFEIIFGRADRLTFIFLHVFTLIAFIGCMYSLHLEEIGQHMAALLYVAGALGVTLAGDYLTLFIFWELMAITSTFLIWCRRKKRSSEAGYRYLLVHITGGLVLFAGIFLRYQNLHDLHFTRIALENASLAEYLIMIGFALNAAVPPLHAWLPDAYPEATVTGVVFMGAFTTKTAVYALARAFPGSEALMIAGAVMALYGVGYATIENDSRRILAYHIISQVGYMVCAIGIGTPLAINGACAFAYANILYKSLLLMGAGSVLEMTGRSKLSELGGLYRYMPATMIFTVIGGISISGFPLTSGFVSKSMIVAAAGEHHHVIIMVMLLAAAVGTFLSIGIKLPYFIWYGGKQSEFTATDPPWNMQLGMAMAAFLCIFIGCYPDYLYRLLPHVAEFHPYTSYHLSETLQILAFTGLGFYLLVDKLRPKPHTNLDLDWFYRKGVIAFTWFTRRPLNAANEIVSNLYKNVGLVFTMATARGISRFDREAIDGFLDGSARGVLRIGDGVRQLVTGRLQQYVGGSLVLFFIVVAIILFN